MTPTPPGLLGCCPAGLAARLGRSGSGAATVSIAPPEPFTLGEPVILGRANQIEEGEIKEFELPDARKVLVTRRAGDRWFGFAALCSHNQLSLQSGVFTSDNKIRCPVHGACFDASTGDIEDYPGNGRIAAFQVGITSAGDIELREKLFAQSGSARDEDGSSRQPQQAAPIVVVGGGPAAQTFIERLRALGNRKPIVLVSKEPYTPYDRVRMSKFPGTCTAASVRLRPASWYEQQRVRLLLGSTVVSVNRQTQEVLVDPPPPPPPSEAATATGAATAAANPAIAYSLLVLAPGGEPRVPLIPGNRLRGVHTLRTLDDVTTIWREADGADVVIVGASFLGMELAFGLHGRARSLTVVSRTERPLPALGDDAGDAFLKLFAEKGVHIVTKAITREVVLVAGGESNDKIVRLADGQQFPAKLVVFTVGISPATEFLLSTGVELDKNGFIKVNEWFQTNVSKVMAIGDAVAFPLRSGGGASLVNLQHWKLAQRQGGEAAHVVAKGERSSKPIVPFFWTYVFGVGVRCSGDVRDPDEIVTHGDIAQLNCTRYYIKERHVVGVMTFGARRTAIEFLVLFERQTRVSLEDVAKNTTDDWTAFLSSSSETAAVS